MFVDYQLAKLLGFQISFKKFTFDELKMEDQDILYHLCIYFLDYIHHIFGLSTNLWMAVSMRFLLGAISGIFDQVQAYATEVYRKECQTWALFAAPNRSFRGDFINYNVSIQSIWSS